MKTDNTYYRTAIEWTEFSMPAHLPYEDGWRFCRECQRFYKTTDNKCPLHRIGLRSCSAKHLRLSHTNLRRVWNNGLGLPLWAQMRDFANSDVGKESIMRFLKIQESIKTKIINAVENQKVTYGELGAVEFKNHWFIKNEDISTARAKVPE